MWERDDNKSALITAAALATLCVCVRYTLGQPEVSLVCKGYWWCKALWDLHASLSHDLTAFVTWSNHVYIILNTARLSLTYRHTLSPDYLLACILMCMTKVITCTIDSNMEENEFISCKNTSWIPQNKGAFFLRVDKTSKSKPGLIALNMISGGKITASLSLCLSLARSLTLCSAV